MICWMQLIYFTIVHLLILINALDNYFNLRPKQFIDLTLSNTTARFVGPFARVTGEDSAFFRLLGHDDSSILVGARDWAYNISIETLRANHDLEWNPDSQIVEDCKKKGKSELECHNYIRVMVPQPNKRLLICGTHAYSPRCRVYQDKTYRREFDGQAISPFDPRQNSTSTYIAEENELYSATVSDFAGNDPLIYWKALDKGNDGIRTQRSDTKVLDAPNFVASFAYGKHIYFWFREWALETNDMDKQVYARVGRVCVGDRGGGTYSIRERWTSFVKVRLNCSIPSDTPYYFNELQAVTKPFKISSGEDVVYAVFTTPESSVQMSAVCAFRMQAVEDSLEHGDFKEPDNSRETFSKLAKLNRMHRQLHSLHPGLCVSDSLQLDETLNTLITFISRNPLLHPAVPALYGQPLFVQSPEKAQLTQIAVIPQARTASGILFNAIFLGTSDGHVLKLVEVENQSINVVETLRVFRRRVPIVNFLTTKKKVVVVSPDEIASIPLYHCERQSKCSGCVHLQDGYCSWDASAGKCVDGTTDFVLKTGIIQDLNTGKSDRCGEQDGNRDYFIGDGRINEHLVTPEKQPVSQSAISRFGLMAMFTVVVVVGSFILGYHVSRWRLTHEMLRHSPASSAGSDYDSYGRARLTHHDSLTTAKLDHHVYANPPSRDAVNLVLTIPQNGSILKGSVSSSNGSGVSTPKLPIEKNLVASFNNGTLPKDYKVKKVYL